MTFEIVPADVPALLGLDVFDAHRLTGYAAFNLRTEQTRIINKTGSVIYVDEWRVLLFRGSRKYDHALIRSLRAVNMFLTRSQLFRLHRHFFHVSVENYSTCF